MDATISRAAPYALRVHPTFERFQQSNVVTKNQHRLVAARGQDGPAARRHPHVRPRC